MLHSYSHVIDKDDMDIVSGYPWMDSIGTINIKLCAKEVLEDLVREKENHIGGYSIAIGPKVANEEILQHLLTHQMKSLRSNQN